MDNVKKRKYRMNLDNNDLANLLKSPSIKIPLENRLQNDFSMHKNSLYKFDEPDPISSLLLNKNKMNSKYEIQPVIKIIPKKQNLAFIKKLIVKSRKRKNKKSNKNKSKGKNSLSNTVRNIGMGLGLGLNLGKTKKRHATFLRMGVISRSTSPI